MRKYGIAVVILLLSSLYIGNVDAQTNSDLAQKFSPILVLTKDEKVPSRRVIYPEPVEIVGANSASNLWFHVGNDTIISFRGWNPTLQKRMDELERMKKIDGSVNFLQNKFAFLPEKFSYTGTPPGLENDEYTVRTRFDFPGSRKETWNNTYFGEGNSQNNDNMGRDFVNTAYVNIYSHTFSPNPNSNASAQTLTVIQYFYFYPYNDWWNNHEGDWQRINIIISADTIMGVEYLFHGAYLGYYDSSLLTSLGWSDVSSITGLASVENLHLIGNRNSPEFNPQAEIKFKDTHPIVYVGAGSHGAFPTGGKYTLLQVSGRSELFGVPVDLPLVDGARSLIEQMTPTGTVLSTEVQSSNPNIPPCYS